MYLSYYGLEEKPFSISTDPKFLWLGEKHKEAFSVLKYGVLDNKGFLLLTGDVGAGKTTLIHALTVSLGDDVIWAAVPDPGLELMDFCRYIAHEFKLGMGFNTKTEFIIIFREFLHDAFKKGKKVLLIVDEAQRLSSYLLEEIRMLSNIELNEVKLLNIFFVGQIEFNNILIEHKNRAVRQRITISYHIKPLSEKETGMYIRHRLKIARAKRNIFSFVAINHIYKYSKGCPRLINIICDLAMLIGYSKEVEKIGVDIIKESIQSFEVKAHLSEEDNLFIKKNEPEKKTINKSLFYLLILLIICNIFFFALYAKWDVAAHFIANLIPVGDVQMDYPSLSRSNFPVVVQQNKDNVVVQQNEDNVVVQQNEDNVVVQQNEDNVSDSESEIGAKPDDSILLPFEFPKTIIYFNHNSNDFADNAYQKLDKLSEFMEKNSEVCVFIIGYTDELGTYAYNSKLSAFRANIVKSYLIGKGVDRLRIKATGLGSANPISTNSTVAGRKDNRRVEIEVFNYYKRNLRIK